MQKVQLRDEVIFSFSFAIANCKATYTCPTQDRPYYKYYISTVDGQTVDWICVVYPEKWTGVSMRESKENMKVENEVSDDR